MIEKIIISASYDDEGPIAKTLAKIEKEALKEQKKSGIANHYFKRSGDDPFSLKAHHCVAGIPYIAYEFMAAHKSSAKQIAVVSDDITRDILKRFVEYSGIEKDKFLFAHEGTDWSLANTWRRGIDRLGAKEIETLLVLPEDGVFISDIDTLLDEKSNADFIMDGNRKDRVYGNHIPKSIGDPFSRRWHLPLRNWLRSYWVKENNVMKIRPSSLLLSYANEFFAARKTHADNGGMSRKDLLKKIYLKDGGAKRAFRDHPISTIKAGAYIASCIYTSYNPAIINPKNASHVLSSGLELNIELRAEHRDIAQIMDIDSVEDAVIAEMLMKSYDPNSLYPYFDEVKAFADEIREKVPKLKDYPQYMNCFVGKMPSLAGSEFYDSHGNFIDTGIVPHAEEKAEYLAKRLQEQVKAQKEKAPQ